MLERGSRTMKKLKFSSLESMRCLTGGKGRDWSVKKDKKEKRAGDSVISWGQSNSTGVGFLSCISQPGFNP